MNHRTSIQTLAAAAAVALFGASQATAYELDDQIRFTGEVVCAHCSLEEARTQAPKAELTRLRSDEGSAVVAIESTLGGGAFAHELDGASLLLRGNPATLRALFDKGAEVTLTGQVRSNGTGIDVATIDAAPPVEVVASR